jgi:hypothetical protein
MQMSGDSPRHNRTPLMRFLTIALFGSAILFGSGVVAWAHTHADAGGTVSWYPADCCHDGDCRPVAEINHASHGIWFTTIDGITILTDTHAERRPSKDMRWHICIGIDDTQTMFVRCIFEPSGS